MYVLLLLLLLLFIIIVNCHLRILLIYRGISTIWHLLVTRTAMQLIP